VLCVHHPQPAAAPPLHCALQHVFVCAQYWDSHCSTFSKLPAVALLATGSCPKGLAPSLFLELLRRLTDLQEWQIWALWDTLDVHSCGFVSVLGHRAHVLLFWEGAAPLLGCCRTLQAALLPVLRQDCQQAVRISTILLGHMCRVRSGDQVLHQRQAQHQEHRCVTLCCVLCCAVPCRWAVPSLPCWWCCCVLALHSVSCRQCMHMLPAYAGPSWVGVLCADCEGHSLLSVP
jgi:hypothetical protein